MKETLIEAAEKLYPIKYTGGMFMPTVDELNNSYKQVAFIAGAKWQQEKLLKFINDEDNHTEGELGNSCIDVQSLIYFLEQFKNKQL
jgi:hypothetical protein